MIKKLEKHIIGGNAPGMVSLMVAPTAEQQVDKINELCDIINTIQKEREAEWFEIKEWIGILEAVRKSVNVHEKQIDELQMKLEPEKCETPTDPYVEQRKWIGKVCWFWDDDNTNSSCGILTSIDTETFKEPQFVCNDEYDYEHCEPVSPDDDIIYKGGDNE